MSQKSDEPTKSYAVFLSFNSEDRETVEKIAIYLNDTQKLRPWFDQWELIPGEPWVRNLERGLEASETCAVFVGKSGEGPWQKREVETALRYQVNNRDFRVIPTLLPDAPKQPELPMFLSGNMWVDFRDKSLNDDDALWRLECGIRGESPGRGRPMPQPEVTPHKQEEILTQAQTKQLVTEQAAPARPKPEPEPAKTTPPPERMQSVPVVRLRSEPLTVSEGEAERVFRTKKKGWWIFVNYKPLDYIKNVFEDQGEVVVDHATGLMWQKSGSENYLTYKDAQKYIEQLNRQRFAGYADWRLPTVEELMSLLEPEKQSNDLFINPIFDKRQRWCWSADKRSSGSAWLVRFYSGSVPWRDLSYYGGYVRGVRA